MDKVDDQVLATLEFVDQLAEVLIAERTTATGFPVLSRYFIVPRAHRGDGGQGHAPRTLAHALTFQ